VLGTDPSGPSIPQHVTWPAGSDDTTPTNQLQYRLQESVNGGAFATVRDWGSSRSTTRTLTPDSSYRYRVQARDLTGNISAAAAAPPFIPRVRQEDDPAFTYTGSWLARAARSTAYGGFMRPTTSTGALARTNFASARNVAVIMRRASTLGEAQICLFQATTAIACQDTDLSPASGLGPRRVVFSRDGLDPGLNYSVRIKDTSGRIELDAVVIDD
jgi:hypothetical protein